MIIANVDRAGRIYLCKVDGGESAATTRGCRLNCARKIENLQLNIITECIERAGREER